MKKKKVQKAKVCPRAKLKKAKGKSKLPEYELIPLPVDYDGLNEFLKKMTLDLGPYLEKEEEE